MEHQVDTWSSELPGGSSLVGRARERLSLEEDLAAAIAGRGRLTLIGGAAGIGKTTLVRNLVREARTRQMLVLAGHCYDLTNTPPWALARPRRWLPAGEPFAHAARRVCRRPIRRNYQPGRALCRGAALRGSVARFGRFSSCWKTYSGPTPPASSSCDTSPAMSRTCHCCAITTYRVDELTRRHPFYQQLPSLIRESHGGRLDLRRLDPEDLRALVRERWRLDPINEARLTDYLERHAEGNPFFATELLRAWWRRVCSITMQGDGWTLTTRPGDRAAAVAAGNRWSSRPLGRGDTHPLAIAAVIGQEVPLDLWANVGEMTEERRC